MKKYLVTSGCSFSDNIAKRWPHYLAASLNLKLHNRGQGSAGNDWISKSLIHETHKLLKSGVAPSEILCVVMWSGIDRKSLYINKRETHDYSYYINDDYYNYNPVNLLESEANKPATLGKHGGYLLGSPNCTFGNKNIQKIKRDLVLGFFNDESLAIESYENFLRVQWFCKSYGVDLINLTYMDIMHYPNNRSNTKTHELYRNVSQLYEMIDFTKWIFWQDTQGLYEYTRDNNLSFYDDRVHPRPESHEYFVTNFLIERISKEVYA